MIVPKSRAVIPPTVFDVSVERPITSEPILVTVVPVETKLPRTTCPREIELVVIPIVVAAPVAIVADLSVIVALNVTLTPGTSKSAREYPSVEAIEIPAEFAVVSFGVIVVVNPINSSLPSIRIVSVSNVTPSPPTEILPETNKSSNILTAPLNLAVFPNVENPVTLRLSNSRFIKSPVLAITIPLPIVTALPTVSKLLTSRLAPILTFLSIPTPPSIWTIPVLVSPITLSVLPVNEAIPDTLRSCVSTLNSPIKDVALIIPENIASPRTSNFTSVRTPTFPSLGCVRPIPTVPVV